MGEDTGPPVRLRGAPRTTSPELARARALWLAALRRRVEDGSYFTPARIARAMECLLGSVRDDLPAR
jgi:hypothetical protein